MSDYDSPWREALDRYFGPFLAFFFPEAHAGIDWSRPYESLDTELQQVVRDAELGRRTADKLLKVWRTSGAEEWVLVHVEVQSQQETDFARRMYVYNYRLLDRYNRQVVSLAVLGDDRPAWRPNRFEYSLGGCTAGIQFPVAKLLDFAAHEGQLEASANPFAVLTLAHLKAQETRQDPAARRTWKGRLVRGLYERGWSAEDVRQLFRFIDWMMDLPQALADDFDQELERYEQEHRMPYVTSIERRGIEKGRTEGLLRGVEMGLKVRFGEAGLQLMPAIRQQVRLELLEALVQALETGASLEDVGRLVEPGQG